MKKIYSRPKSLKPVVFHYCPGCGHSIAHRLACEVIDEMGLQDKVIGIPPPGCSVFAYNYFTWTWLNLRMAGELPWQPAQTGLPRIGGLHLPG